MMKSIIIESVEICPPEVMTEYEYSVLVSTRVQDLMDGHPPLVDVPKGTPYNYFEIATREILGGKFSSRIVRDRKILDPNDMIIQCVPCNSGL